ncbi:HEAT repeat domain-containing protein [Synechococcus sp. CS-1326]|uniref:HEAT repeat domain-containing protein n=1 Tax=Synechococcus sp. CS-1326 TaxID=2847978 RepID=UPI00223B536A|nr:HEAT repeat domain-containing protein [Synechococcus sp. CS-1326]MCT0213211.1 HEAT repeat domain-containing protein [Synechococcus sp. CS-1326]
MTTSASPDELASLIAAVKLASTGEALLDATEALSAKADPGSLDCLMEILTYNNPGAAVAAVDGLISIGEPAVAPLLANLDQHNYGARAWAIRVLAGIGDVRGLAVLEQALAKDMVPSVRRAAAHGLGQLQLQGLGQEQQVEVIRRCLASLERGLSDGEWIVRYAVAVGLEKLTPALHLLSEDASRLIESLSGLVNEEQEPVMVVRMRADLALRRLKAKWPDRNLTK